jgi:hypothetical protein
MDLLKRNFFIRELLLVAILVLITIVFRFLGISTVRPTIVGERFAACNDLNDHRSDAAVEDFRTALLHDPQNWEFGMQLADALT